MVHVSIRRFIVITVAVLVASVTFPTYTSRGTPPDDDATDQYYTDPTSDAKAIATIHGISLEQLEHAERVVGEATNLQNLLTSNFSESFGGLFFEYNPVRITVNWRNESGISPPDEVLENPNVTLQYVGFTEMDLQRTQARLTEVAIDNGLKLDTWTDIREGLVKADIERESHGSLERIVETHDAGDLRWDLVEISEVDELAVDAANIYAGLPTTGCTSGFVVRSTTTGARRGTVAGHCGNTQTFNGVSSVYLGEWYSGSRDFQVHSFASSHALLAAIKLESGTRSITSSASISNTIIGLTVCKMGNITGYTCGAVSSRNHQPSYVPSASPTFVKVDRLPGVGTPIVQKGDSGGPWFVNSTAYGWTSGLGNDGAYGIYMSLSYLPSPWVVAHA